MSTLGEKQTGTSGRYLGINSAVCVHHTLIVTSATSYDLLNTFTQFEETRNEWESMDECTEESWILFIHTLIYISDLRDSEMVKHRLIGVRENFYSFTVLVTSVTYIIS